MFFLLTGHKTKYAFAKHILQSCSLSIGDTNSSLPYYRVENTNNDNMLQEMLGQH